MAKQEIIGPGYLGRSSNINASRCVNLYPELNSQDSKSIGSLAGTPGTLLFVDTLLSNVRGMHYFNNLIYFVSGDKLFSVNNAGFVSQIIDSGTGVQVTLATATGPVSMADNGMYSVGGAVANQLILTDGISIHVVNVSTLATVSFPYAVNTVCFIGGYFVIDIIGAQWRSSSLYDGTVWNGLDISTADASPDNLMAVVNNHNELWLIGEYTTEIWYQSGTGNPPFSRQSGGVIDYGTNAPYSVAKGANTLFWLVNQRNGESGEFIGVGMVSGYGLEIISPQSINDQISRYAIISDAFSFCYADRGHEFLQITFPTANATWTYDATTKMWHERSLYTAGPYVIGRHIANCYAYAWGKHFIGDFASGKIYEMSESYYTDNGLPIASVRTASPLDDKSNNNNFFINKLQLDMETGVGDGSAPNPIAMPLLDINVGIGPGSMATNGKYVWISNTNVGTVSKIDKISNSLISTITVGLQPTSVIFAYNYVWVSNYGSGTISKIDPDSDVVLANIVVGPSPCRYSNGLTSGGGYIWMASYGTRAVYYINPISNALAVIPHLFAGALDAIDYNGGYLWVTEEPGTIYKIDAVTLTVLISTAISGIPTSVKYAASYVWATAYSSNKITKINPVTNAVIMTITVGNAPYELAFDGTYLWSVNYSSATLSRINLATNTVTLTYPITGSPYGIIYDPIDRDIWVAIFTTNKVSKIRVWEDSPGANPQAVLSWSVDGGHTWSNDHSAQIGKQGEYTTRLIWNRLGCSRNRIFRIAISSPVKKVLSSEYIDAEGGLA